jgi:peptidoglycan/xylan/chitin deacetylase (PgdA/CDA1 family)
MYHYVSPLSPDADPLRANLTVSPPVFRSQMQYLRDRGYTTISLYELNSALLMGIPLPPKPIILTFDDGYADHYTTVFPTLRNGFTATFFVITGAADANDPAHLSWAQISEMAAAGMSMESHSKTHSDLRGRSYDFLVYELLGSTQSLAAHTGQVPRIFCYPSGRYDENTLVTLRTIPIWLAVTTN